MPTTKFITQPDERVGDILIDAVTEKGIPAEFAFVSAFASLTAVIRFKEMAQQTVDAGGTGRLVVGVDLGGTSKQVLIEVGTWPVPVFVVKNSMPGVTFHPKIYHMRWSDSAVIIVGSNNLTDGGLFRNYEAAAVVWYDLPIDASAYAANIEQIRRFIEPGPPTGKELTAAYLASLLALTEIPSESDARSDRKRRFAGDVRQPIGVFEFEPVFNTPRLPPELQRLVLAARGEQRAEYNRKVREYRHRLKGVAEGRVPDLASPLGVDEKEPQLEKPLAYMNAQEFYVHLPRMKADNLRIPGEMRIPLEALEVAPGFWGWPDEYVDREISPRGGTTTTEERQYKDRKAIWRTWAVENSDAAEESDVRMYMYQNSSDFRLMIGALNKLEGRRGDIIRVTPGFGGSAAYECALARAGTPQHAEWLTYMVNTIRNSDRRYGYA